MKDSYKMSEKLYNIGLMGAVMGLKGSSIDYYGRSYKTKLGEYELKSYYFSYDRDDIKIAEIDIACVDLLKDGKFIKNVFYSKSRFKTRKFIDALIDDNNVNGINKRGLREDFISYMFNNDNKDIRNVTSDNEYQKINIKSSKFIEDIDLKVQEIENEYREINNKKSYVLSKKIAQQ